MDCPTPSKHSFPTAWDAKKAMKRWGKKPGRASSGKLEIYRCDCGSWHIGHGNGISKRRRVA